MRISLLIILGGSSLLLASPLGAQSQQEMNAQSRKDLKEADAQLNATYQKVITRLPDEKSVALLRKAQRAWLSFRDADAASYADAMRGGSAAPLLFYGQQTQLTRYRIKQLKRYLETYGEN